MQNASSTLPKPRTAGVARKDLAGFAPLGPLWAASGPHWSMSTLEHVHIGACPPWSMPQKWVFFGKRFLHDWASEQRSQRATAWKRLVRASRIFFVFRVKVRNLIIYLCSGENSYFRKIFSYFEKIFSYFRRIFEKSPPPRNRALG